jgi:hypothetical protein
MNPFVPRSFHSGLRLALVLVAALHSASGAVLTIGRNFTATIYPEQSSAVPPDSNGAVGPDHYVELINGRFAIYRKSNGSVVTNMTDLEFWRRAGVVFPRNWDVTDPRVVYDPGAKRWFASQIDFDPGGFANTNRLLLAVSTTSDPAQAWRGFAIAGDPGRRDFADFPTLGLDAEAVYISAELFDTRGNPAGLVVVSVPKASLLANPPGILPRFSSGPLDYARHGYIAQPAVCLDGSAVGRLLSTQGLGINEITGDFETHNTLVGLAILDPATPAKTTLATPKKIPVPDFTAPINGPQPDGTTTLDNGDARFSGAVQCVAGTLFAVHSTQVEGVAAIRWYRINAADFALLESGTIRDPLTDYFYPSIAVNHQGTVVICFNASSVTTYVSSFAVVGETMGGVTRFGAPVLLKAGTANYQNTGSDGISRWGDYSATSVDPADPARFWTIQVVPRGSRSWATQVTELITAPLQLAISRAGDHLRLSWPAEASDYQLQSTPDPLSPASWALVPQLPSIINGQLSVSLPPAGALQFFRLMRSP